VKLILSIIPVVICLGITVGCGSEPPPPDIADKARIGGVEAETHMHVNKPGWRTKEDEANMHKDKKKRR
jgi:hypothetical protein